VPEREPLRVRVAVELPDGEPVRAPLGEVAGELDVVSLGLAEFVVELLTAADTLAVREGAAEPVLLLESGAERDAVGDRDATVGLPDADRELDGEALGAHGSRLMPREKTGSPASSRGAGRS
jgi:hypothetical protein